jgi:hypothetical protein
MNTSSALETSGSLTLRQYFSLLAFVGFAVSLIIHLLTFLGLNLNERVPWIWILHLGIFIVFVPMLIAPLNWERKHWWRNFLAPMPKWVHYIAYGFFAYGIINFLIFISLSMEGSPDIRDGKYVLRSDGRVEDQRVIREISKEEYDLRNDRIVRGFSGHWMIFYLIPALYFWFPRSEIKEDDN